MATKPKQKTQKKEKSSPKEKSIIPLPDKPLVLPSIAKNTPFTKEQLAYIVTATPKKYIYTRPAKGGGTWSYVKGSYIKKSLNFLFGFNWSFEIITHGIEGKQVQVLGKLTIPTKQGVITKMQYGRADIKFRKGTNVMLDFGNDLKAGATDCLKKCASELGLCADVYSMNEEEEIKTEQATVKAEVEKEDAVKSAQKKLNKAKKK